MAAPLRAGRCATANPAPRGPLRICYRKLLRRRVLDRIRAGCSAGLARACSKHTACACAHLAVRQQARVALGIHSICVSAGGDGAAESCAESGPCAAGTRRSSTHHRQWPRRAAGRGHPRRDTQARLRPRSGGQCARCGKAECAGAKHPALSPYMCTSQMDAGNCWCFLAAV